MEQEIKVKRTEYGFVVIDIPEGEDRFSAVYGEYTAGNVNWGNEDFEIIDETDAEASDCGREAHLSNLLENAVSYIREQTVNPDEMDYQQEFIRVLTEDLGMTADEIKNFGGIEVDEE